MAESGETSLVVGSCSQESMDSRAGNRKETQMKKSEVVLLGHPQSGQNARFPHMNEYFAPFCG